VIGAPPNVAHFDQVVARFLTNHGFPVRDYTTGAPQNQHTGLARPGEVAYSPEMNKTIARLGAHARKGKRRRLNGNEQEAMRLALHEGLHQMRYGRTPEFYDGGTALGTVGGYEEGATEAVAQDLLPIIARKRFGHLMPGYESVERAFTAYPEQTWNVRQLSTFGSGAKSYRDRKARVWRRTFLHSDPDARARMIEQANSARAEWGKRSGR